MGDFATNKRICEEVASIQSKALRNKIAGYLTHLMKRIAKGPVRGISLKLQEEEVSAAWTTFQTSLPSTLRSRRVLRLMLTPRICSAPWTWPTFLASMWLTTRSALATEETVTETVIIRSAIKRLIVAVLC